MKILKISQSDQRDLWLQERFGRITGAKSKGIRPLTRGADRTPAGFWQLVAEKIAVPSDGEDSMQRGHRLENEAMQLTAEKVGFTEIDLDPGMWVSDISDDIAFSPDACEPSDAPTWSAEAKCLNTANHIKYVVKDMQARDKEDYNPISSVPNESGHTYREQVIQAFVVNEHLQDHYFTFYDDRVIYEKYMHHVIHIRREDITDLIAEQLALEQSVLNDINALITEISKEQ